MSKNAYELFFSKYVKKEDFFDFGLKELITISPDDAEKEWQALKYRIENNQKTFIRGFGRGGRETLLFKDFYFHCLKHTNTFEDPTNNAEPSKMLRRLTKHSKTPCKGYTHIENYQISHVFGRTKNLYAFTAPWNVVYIPKILDPFTGHEAKGDFVDEFTKLFQENIFIRFKPLIKDFNQIMENQEFKENVLFSMQRLTEFCNDTQIAKLSKALQSEFSPISVSEG